MYDGRLSPSKKRIGAPPRRFRDSLDSVRLPGFLRSSQPHLPVRYFDATSRFEVTSGWLPIRVQQTGGHTCLVLSDFV